MAAPILNAMVRPDDDIVMAEVMHTGSLFRSPIVNGAEQDMPGGGLVDALLFPCLPVVLPTQR